MTAVIKFENVWFVEAYNKKITNHCNDCSLENQGVCAWHKCKEIIDKCDYGASGHWSYGGVERSIIDD